jgi:hypothetical protein
MVTLHAVGRVRIRMFDGDHNPPHFHIWTPDGDAQVLLSDLTLLRGTVGPRDYELAMRWARSNIAYLWSEWERRNG